MWDSTTVNMLVENTWITLYMTLVSTLIAYAIGLPLGVILVVAAPGGLKPGASVCGKAGGILASGGGPWGDRGGPEYGRGSFYHYI